MTNKYLQVTTTTESKEHAQNLARTIVEARLAACVQILGPIEGTYRWNDELETSREWMCLMKTTGSAYPALEALIRAQHTYETPEIIASPITEGSDDYLEWIGRETEEAP